jgi:hypothetical protein
MYRYGTVTIYQYVYLKCGEHVLMELVNISRLCATVRLTGLHHGHQLAQRLLATAASRPCSSFETAAGVQKLKIKYRFYS